MEAFLVRKLPVVNAERQMLNAEGHAGFLKREDAWLPRLQSEDALVTEMAKRGRFAYCPIPPDESSEQTSSRDRG